MFSKGASGQGDRSKRTNTYNIGTGRNRPLVEPKPASGPAERVVMVNRSLTDRARPWPFFDSQGLGGGMPIGAAERIPGRRRCTA